MKRGWRGTKLHVTLIGLGVLTAVYAAMSFPAEHFSTYCTFATGLVGGYMAGNVSESIWAKPQKPTGEA